MFFHPAKALAFFLRPFVRYVPSSPFFLLLVLLVDAERSRHIHGVPFLFSSVHGKNTVLLWPPERSYVAADSEEDVSERTHTAFSAADISGERPLGNKALSTVCATSGDATLTLGEKAAWQTDSNGRDPWVSLPNFTFQAAWRRKQSSFSFKNLNFFLILEVQVLASRDFIFLA